LRAAGASAAHPVALVAHATLPQQRVVRGSLGDIVELAGRGQIVPPALLIVGQVAAFAPAGALAAAGELTGASARAPATPARAAGSRPSPAAGALA
jgi:siroheme synthase